MTFETGFSNIYPLDDAHDDVIPTSASQDVIPISSSPTTDGLITNHINSDNHTDSESTDPAYIITETTSSSHVDDYIEESSDIGDEEPSSASTSTKKSFHKQPSHPIPNEQNVDVCFVVQVFYSEINSKSPFEDRTLDYTWKKSFSKPTRGFPFLRFKKPGNYTVHLSIPAAARCLVPRSLFLNASVPGCVVTFTGDTPGPGFESLSSTGTDIEYKNLEFFKCLESCYFSMVSPDQVADDIFRALSTLPKLTVVCISNTDLRRYPTFLESLSRIEDLKLDYAQLSSFPSAIFQMKDLWRLSLIGNHIKVLPEEIESLKLLTYLDISFGDLEAIPLSLTKMGQLNHLDFESNHIGEFFPQVPDLTSMKSLKHLNISCCDLTTFPKNICTLPALEYLDLSDNSITTLPDEFINFKDTLLELILSCVGFTSFPKVICSLSKLEIIDVAHNDLGALPPEFSQLTALTSVEMNDDGFTVFPEVLFSLVSLASIIISENPFSSIPDGIRNLTSLETLHAEACNLQEFPPALQHLTSLDYLYLGGNNISTIPDFVQNMQFEDLDLLETIAHFIPGILLSVIQKSNKMKFVL